MRNERYAYDSTKLFASNWITSLSMYDFNVFRLMWLFEGNNMASNKTKTLKLPPKTVWRFSDCCQETMKIFFFFFFLLSIPVAVGKYLNFLLFPKKRLIFFKNSFYFLFFFKVFPTSLFTLLHLRGSFCIPSVNHEVDLLLRYRFTAEIKSALVSYLFPASLFFF